MQTKSLVYLTYEHINFILFEFIPNHKKIFNKHEQIIFTFVMFLKFCLELYFINECWKISIPTRAMVRLRKLIHFQKFLLNLFSRKHFQKIEEVSQKSIYANFYENLFKKWTFQFVWRRPSIVLKISVMVFVIIISEANNQFLQTKSLFSARVDIEVLQHSLINYYNSM